MNNILYILIFSILLFSCADSEKLSPVQTEEKTEATLDTEILAAIKIRGKWGYVNPEGEVVIEIQFDDARSFRITK